MQNLCKECYFIGKGLLNRSDHSLLEISLWVVFLLIVIYFLFTSLILFVLSVPLLGIPAFYSVFYRGKKHSFCPKCKKESMIPIDTPKAQELIKTHNLVVPEEPIETSKAPWQTS